LSDESTANKEIKAHTAKKEKKRSLILSQSSEYLQSLATKVKRVMEASASKKKIILE